jgi:tetratricopeptide (TPR) repeat protein
MNHRAVVVAATGLLIFAVGCAHRDNSGASKSQPDEFGSVSNPPIVANTHFAAGQLAESEGRLPQAIDQYNQALSGDPKHLDSLYRLGVVYAELKDYPHAIHTWNRYIELSGGSATAYSNLGFCQELAGNPSAAEAAYLKGIAADSSNEPCHVNYGLMLARRGKSVEALRQLQIVLPPAQAHYDLASIYQMQGHKDQARAECQKAIELDPQFQDAKQKLAALN